MRSRRPSPITGRSTAWPMAMAPRPGRRTWKLRRRSSRWPRIERAAMITLTEKAARHVTNHLVKRGKGIGLRLGVRTTGCSGLAYKLEYADAVNPEDHVFESHDVKVL